MSGGVMRFERYGPPAAGAATAYRDLDNTVSEATVLRRENQQLRAAKADVLASLDHSRATERELATALAGVITERDEIAAELRAHKQFVEDLGVVLSYSPADDETCTDRGPAAGERPEVVGQSATSGQPNLTVDDLRDAAIAVRCHSGGIGMSLGNAQAWNRLADRLVAAAEAQK